MPNASDCLMRSIPFLTVPRARRLPAASNDNDRGTPDLRH